MKFPEIRKALTTTDEARAEPLSTRLVEIAVEKPLSAKALGQALWDEFRRLRPEERQYSKNEVQKAFQVAVAQLAEVAKPVSLKRFTKEMKGGAVTMVVGPRLESSQAGRMHQMLIDVYGREEIVEEVGDIRANLKKDPKYFANFVLAQGEPVGLISGFSLLSPKGRTMMALDYNTLIEAPDDLPGIASDPNAGIAMALKLLGRRPKVDTIWVEVDESMKQAYLDRGFIKIADGVEPENLEMLVYAKDSQIQKRLQKSSKYALERFLDYARGWYGNVWNEEDFPKTDLSKRVPGDRALKQIEAAAVEGRALWVQRLPGRQK